MSESQQKRDKTMKGINMLSSIKLDTLRIDSGKPFVIIDLNEGKNNKIFLTKKDMKVLIKYFTYAEEILYQINEQTINEEK